MFRHEVQNAWVFTSLAEVRAVSEGWRLSYSTELAHDSLGRVPPLTLLPTPSSGTESDLRLCA
jgi:hypothetical protein